MPPRPPGPRTAADRWVLEQVTAQTRDVIDLASHFPADADRILSASFLEQLLTSSYGIKVHYHGVRIKNAVVAEPVDLESAVIPFEVWLTSFRFKSSVNLSKSIFAKTVGLNQIVFQGPVDFSSATVRGSLWAEGADFADTAEGVDFSALRVEREASLYKAHFAGPVVFRDAWSSAT